MSFHCRKQPSARVLQLSLSFAIFVHTAPCVPTMSSLPFSVLCYLCPYRSLLPHNVISPFLCPLLSLSIPLPVAPQCHLSLSLSFAIFVHTAHCCPTMSSLPKPVGLPTDLMPFVCPAVLLMSQSIVIHSGDVSIPFPYRVEGYVFIFVTHVVCLMTILSA